MDQIFTNLSGYYDVETRLLSPETDPATLWTICQLNRTMWDICHSNHFTKQVLDYFLPVRRELFRYWSNPSAYKNYATIIGRDIDTHIISQPETLAFRAAVRDHNYQLADYFLAHVRDKIVAYNFRGRGRTIKEILLVDETIDAIDRSDLPVIKYLISRGASPNYYKPVSADTPSYLENVAWTMNRSEIYQYLMSKRLGL